MRAGLVLRGHREEVQRYTWFYPCVVVCCCLFCTVVSRGRFCVPRGFVFTWFYVVVFSACTTWVVLCPRGSVTVLSAHVQFRVDMLLSLCLISAVRWLFHLHVVQPLWFYPYTSGFIHMWFVFVVDGLVSTQFYSARSSSLHGWFLLLGRSTPCPKADIVVFLSKTTASNCCLLLVVQYCFVSIQLTQRFADQQVPTHAAPDACGVKQA